MATRASRTLIQRSRAESSAAKASFHEVEGAGRSKVRREFFGLNTADEQALLERIDRGLQGQLDRNR